MKEFFDQVTKHNCEDNKVTNCDGEFHHHFCAVCGKDFGTTDCDDAGTR